MLRVCDMMIYGGSRDSVWTMSFTTCLCLPNRQTAVCALPGGRNIPINKYKYIYNVTTIYLRLDEGKEDERHSARHTHQPPLPRPA
jgi:hypothetical protein